MRIQVWQIRETFRSRAVTASEMISPGAARNQYDAAGRRRSISERIAKRNCRTVYGCVLTKSEHKSATVAGERDYRGSDAIYSGNGWLAARNRASCDSAGLLGSSMLADTATKAASGSRPNSTARACNNLASMRPTAVLPSRT